MSQTTDLIRALTQAGLSQTEISRRTGIPQPRISRWANGEVPVGADDALRLQALAQTAPELVGRDGARLEAEADATSGSV